MIRLFLIIYLCLIFLPNYIISQDRYSENAHKYIVRQAWEYLKWKKPQINWNATPMASHIEMGTAPECGYNNEPWDVGSIVIGSCREDEEDPVWRVGFPSPTVSHFWKADQGDDWEFCPYVIDCFANSYKKSRAYMYSNSVHRIFFYKESVDPNYGTIFGRFYLYDNLFDFYNTGHCYYWGYLDVAYYEQQVYNPPLEMNIPLSTSQKWSWLLLGRLCHLLADNCTPVHAHGLSHWGGESYEDFMETNCYNWDYTLHGHNGNTTLYLGPEDIITLNNKQNPLRYLFYVANQVADRFPAMSDPGNSTYTSIIGNDNYAYYIQPIYSSINNNLVGDNVYKGDYCFNFAIKATASLLYWFAENTNQFPPQPPSNLTIASNMIGGPALGGYTLYKNTNGWFWPTAQGTNLSYEWHYYICASTNYGYWPYNNYGITMTTAISDRLFNIVNNNYQGVYCPTCLDNAPAKLDLRMKLRVYDNYNQSIWSDIHRINPSTNCGGGCPYVFVYGTDTSGNRTMLMDNNLLHRSEFTENANQNITDV